MLFWLLLLSLVVSILLSRRLCIGASPSRIYTSLFSAFSLSVAIQIIRFLHRFPNLHKESLWHLMDVVFRYICFAYPIWFLIIFWIVMHIGKRRRVRSSPVPAIISTMMITIPVLLLTIGIYAERIEPNLIEVTRTRINTSKLEKGSKPIKIVQLSDLHIDKFGKREKHTIQIVKELHPDLILLTGDYTNSWKNSLLVRRFLKELHAKYGVYAIHGNWNTGPKSKAFFEDTDIKVLNYNRRIVNTDSGKIAIIGVPWHEGRRSNPNIPIGRIDTSNKYVILLCHIPDIALHAPSQVDLILSGHTHGGQVRLPFIGPVITLSAIEKNRAAGLSKLQNGGYLYVNRGLGMEGGWAPRIRFLCRPEITVINLYPDKK